MIGIVDEDGRTTRVRLLAPLAFRDFRLLWTGMTLSLLGDGVLLVALAWQAYELSNRPAAMSLVGAALTIPQLVLVLFGGVISDRVERRRLMLGADLVRGASLAVLAWLSISGELVLWHLVVFAAVYGSASAFFMPAFDALVPSLVPESRLTEANALDQFVRPAMLWLLGPALGGVLIGTAGVGWAFALDAATFAASAICLSRLTRIPPGETVSLSIRAVITELREGFAFVRSRRWLWVTFVAATFTYLLFLGPTEVLLPYLIKNELGGDAHDFGLVLAAGGVAALATAFVIGQTGLPRRAVTFTYLAWAAATLAVAGYGLAHTRWQAMSVAALISGFETLGAVAWMTTKQRLIPRELLGRVSSFDWFISIALVPVSFLVTAPVAAAIGVRETLIGAGVIGASHHVRVLVRARGPRPRPAAGPPGREGRPSRRTGPVVTPQEAAAVVDALGDSFATGDVDAVIERFTDQGQMMYAGSEQGEVAVGLPALRRLLADLFSRDERYSWRCTSVHITGSTAGYSDSRRRNALRGPMAQPTQRPHASERSLSSQRPTRGVRRRLAMEILPRFGADPTRGDHGRNLHHPRIAPRCRGVASMGRWQACQDAAERCVR